MALLADERGQRIQRAGVSMGIEKRIFFLDPADRKLLEMTLQGRLTRREAGMLVGRSSGAVTRRIHALLARLNDPLVKALADEGELLPEYHRDVGLAYFLRRTPVRRIAVELGLSKYEVRRIIVYVRGWHGAGRRRR